MISLICCYALKGGTSKTATSVNLAAFLARSGFKTILIDIDPQRNSTFHLNGSAQGGTVFDWLMGEPISIFSTTVKSLSLIPGDIRLFSFEPGSDSLFKNAVATLECDFCIVDCPPGLSNLTSQAILASDRILMPIICRLLSIRGVSESVSLIRQRKPQAKIDVLRARHRANIEEYRQAEQILIEGTQHYHLLLLPTRIPENTDIGKSVFYQNPVIECLPYSVGAKAYVKMAQDYLELLQSTHSLGAIA